MGSDQLFKKRKALKEKELARTKAKRGAGEVSLIVCEDSKSSVYYFQKLIKAFRLNPNLVRAIPSAGSAPISVVDYAIEIAKKDTSVDHLFCVFDRDEEYKNYDCAMQKIYGLNVKRRGKGKPIYKAITSTPCYEIWLLLHFKYTTKSYNSSGKKSAADNLIDDLRSKNHIPFYEKNNVEWFDELFEKLGDAVKHAKRLQQHNGSTNSQNPATDIHELVEFLKVLSKR